MKNSIIVLSLVFLFSCQEEKRVTSEAIKESLKLVVIGETKAYMEKDYQKWASFWDHSSDVLRLDVTEAGFSQTRGWDNSGGNLESFFKENPEPITSTFENSNYLIFHDENLAWMAFDQAWTTQMGEKSVAKAAITLLKKSSNWKIISYTAIQYEAENQNISTLERD